MAEVAAVLRVSKATVYAMVERGELEHFRVVNSIRVPREAVEASAERSAAPDATSRSSRRPTKA